MSQNGIVPVPSPERRVIRVHRIYLTGKLHGWHLRNVQVACKRILQTAEPISGEALTRATNNYEVCPACSESRFPAGHTVMYLKDMEGL